MVQLPMTKSSLNARWFWSLAHWSLIWPTPQFLSLITQPHIIYLWLWLMAHRYQLSAICYLLLPQSQSPDDISVAFRVLSIQIRQLAPALSNQLQQPSPRMFVVLVVLEVLDQVIDSGRKQCDLHLR
jgi:hypothetical protein